MPLSETKTKPRATQAERSAAMRQRLSKAAFDVIKDVGYASFRTITVSKAAGVSQGAQLHHYPTKDSLTIAAMEYAYEQAHQSFMRNIQTFNLEQDPLDAIIADAKDFFMSDYFMVALDILMAGGKNKFLHDELVTLAVTSRQKVERAWMERLVDLGWPLSESEDILTMTFSLVRGFAIKFLISRDERECNHLLERWKEMVQICKNQQPA